MTTPPSCESFILVAWGKDVMKRARVTPEGTTDGAETAVQRAVDSPMETRNAPAAAMARTMHGVFYFLLSPQPTTVN